MPEVVEVLEVVVVLEVVAVPAGLTITEYILAPLPALPPRVMVPEAKDRTKRRRGLSVVTRFAPVSVKALSHEGFGEIPVS